MTIKEANHLEEVLEFNDYHQSRCTSSTNDYSMFKTVRDNTELDDEGRGKLLYQIEFRFWDWTKYPHHNVDDEFSVDICILDEVKHRADVNLSYPMNIEDVEHYAARFHELNKNFML